MGELLFLVLAFVVCRWIAWDLDRGRIRECIESCGGKVLDVAFKSAGNRWLGNSERIYDVQYETPDGKVCEATCKTKMFAGVDWIATVPPGLAAHQPAQNAYASGETISCLQCGASIPAGHSHCDNCGWSYIAG